MTASRLLALETSSATATIALALGTEIAERTIETQRAQAGSVLECVDALLAEAGIALADLDAIVFGQGPGSFTGIRIAAAVAQGLSLASDRPIVPVSSLAALAQRGFAAMHDGPAAGVGQALSCVDARMGEVYFGWYRWAGGLAEAIGPERIGPPAGVSLPAGGAGRASGGAGQPSGAGSQPAGEGGDAAYLAFGDGLANHAEALAGIVAGAVVCQPALVPRARDLLPLAAGRVATGDFVPLAAALPVYLRDADAWHRS